MSCYHPLKRFVIGTYDTQRCMNGNLKDYVKITPAFFKENGRLMEVTALRYGGVEWEPWTGPVPDSGHGRFVHGKMIRCGHCLGCRIDKSREWANRCIMELQDHKDAYFLTLTYDEEHVPLTSFKDPETGVDHPTKTLVKKDLQGFIKRLRKRVEPDRIRYFACGEYGSKTQRPHYHAIVFGLRLNDLVPYGMNELNQMTYTSNFIHSVWSSRKAPTRHGSVTPLSADPSYFCTPWGRVVIAPCTWETCAYVARYTVKKLYGDKKEDYAKFGLEPPFLLMSTHPGIGDNFFHEHYQEILELSEISIGTANGGKSFRPPYRFEKLLERELPWEEYFERKYQREQAMLAARQVEMSQTSLTYGEVLAVKERALQNRIKKLERRLE